MRLTITLVVFILTKYLAYSQSDFRHGFIVTHESDTLQGLINYSEGAKAFAKCSFKKQKRDDVVNYGPVDIAGYGFAGNKQFLSKNIQKVDTSYEEVFLQVLARGLVTLYRYDKTFYIEKADAGIFRLSNDPVEQIVDGQTVLRKSNRHIAVLNMLMFDCSEVRPRLQKISLTERPLTELVTEYNRCVGVADSFQLGKNSWIKVMPGITAGIDFSKLNFTADIPGYDHLIGDYSYSKLAVVGLSLELVSPKISERLSFKTSALYMPTNYYHFNITNENNSIQRNYITIKLKQLKIPIGLSYTLPENFFAPFVNAGISGTFHLVTSSDWTREVERYNAVNTYSSEVIDFKKVQLGYWGGIGIAKSIGAKISASLEFRYEKTNGIIDVPVGSGEFKSTIVNYQIIFGLKLKH